MPLAAAVLASEASVLELIDDMDAEPTAKRISRRSPAESTETEKAASDEAVAPVSEKTDFPEKSSANVPELVVPPILFEGDTTPPVIETGPGQKYALGPTPPATGSIGERGYLPLSYGTGELFLAARDPHWLYAHWDLTEQQQRRYNLLSADHHLVVRVTPGTVRGHASNEIHVHPESRHWFIHVDRAGTNYTAELGYYPSGGEWVTVTPPVSAATPPDTVSSDRSVRFATIAPARPLQGSMQRAPRLRRVSVPTLEQTHERALADAVSKYFEKQEAPGSADIPGLVGGVTARKDLAEKAGGVGAAPEIRLDVAPDMGAKQPSSMYGPEVSAPKGFWLNVNAELVLYGATEPDATLLIDGYPVQIRPDGTFSYRFALPDGDYEIALWAMSAEGDLRQAILKFRRASNYEGEVGAHPQDPALTAPPAEKE